MRPAIITVALLTLGVVVAWALPPLPETRGIASYLPLHTLLETSAIVIAVLVFAVGWNAYRRGLPGNVLLLACVFLGVGALDFTHTISYLGMPDFVTPSSPEKAIDFWLSARTLAAIALFIVSVTPWRPATSAASRYVLLATVLILTGGLHWLFLFHDDLMPRTFIPGQGLTPFKIYYEYALVALNLAAALALWLRMRKPLPFNAAALFGAACAMALSEFFFTLYADVADLYNLLGHIYKTVSYLFLYRAIFVETIELPYNQLQATQNQLQATLDAMPDLLFELDLDGRYHDYHSPRTDLLTAPAEAILGKTASDLLPPDAAKVVMSALLEAHEKGWSTGKQLDLQLPQGKVWFELSVARKHTSPGQTARFIVLRRDITERKRAETLLGGQNQVLEMIAAGVPLAETLTALVRFIEAQSPGMLGSILLLDEDGVHVRHGAAPSLPAEFVDALDDQPIGPCAGSCGTAAYRKEAVFVDDIATDPLWANYKAAALPHGLHACWSTPIFDTQRRVLGTFAMYYREPGLPQPEHLKLIDTVTHTAAIAISRHREEHALRMSEARIRSVFEQANDGIYIISAENRYLDANARGLELLGYTRDELLQMGVADVLAPHEVARLAVEPPQMMSGVPHLAEWEHVRKEGATFPGEVSARRLDDHSYLAIVRDLTERRQAEAALRESEKKFRAIIESSPVAMAVNDEHQNVTFLNRKFIETFGYTLTDIPTLAEWWPRAYPDPGYRLRVAQEWQAAVEKAQRDKTELEPMEYKVTGKDGSVRDIRFSMAPMGASSLVIFYDLTERKQAEEALWESNEKLRLFVNYAPSAIAMFDRDMRYIAFSQRWLSDYGLGEREIAGRSHYEIFPDLPERWKEIHRRCLAGAVEKCDEDPFPRADGTVDWVRWEVHPWLTGNGDIGGLIIFSEVITGRKRAEAELRKLSLAVEQSPNSIIIANLDANIEYVNDTFVNLTGYSRDEVIGKNPRILQSGKTPKATHEDMWAHLTRGEMWRGELINKRKDGSEYIELAMISPVRQADGRISHYLAIKENITEAKQAEARIERLAHFDQLTGLPNRSLLLDRFSYAVSLVQRSGEPLAVMFLDLDHFKNVNDTLGHTIGDQLLMEVAKRIKATLREEDTVSRQGGDEFMLILHATDADGAAYVAAKLIEAVSQPCQIEQYELTTTASIGIAIYPHDGEDFETLSKHADAAMFRVKQGGRNNFRFFTPEMQAHSARTLQLANALRHALERNELQLHYQPQLSIQNGHIIGAEALLRWRHPELGMISPGEFIPIAEDSGQIIPIGAWVLRTAAKQLKDWIDGGLPPMVMAVNLSSLQFRQANITGLITHILDEVQLPHEYLELELTEAVAMGDPLAAIEVMDKLHERGIRMSIDDFGTGYSSLSYLKKFKVYKLKIDQSFVRDITDDPDDKAIVSAIINMAGSLGIQTIAEGVETAGQLAFLRLQGCDEVQGYYFSKPLPAEQFEAFVKKS